MSDLKVLDDIPSLKEFSTQTTDSNTYDEFYARLLYCGSVSDHFANACRLIVSCCRRNRYGLYIAHCRRLDGESKYFRRLGVRLGVRKNLVNPRVVIPPIYKPIDLDTFLVD